MRSIKRSFTMKTNFVLGAASAVASIGVASRNLIATQSRATDTAPLPGLGASPPETTPPPGLDDIQKGLFKRDSFSLLFAPDNTCGWISGSSAAPYLCNSGDTCCLVLPPSTGQGFIFCSQRGYVGFERRYVKCFDYSNYHASTDCGECHNGNVLKCESSSLPYCNTYYFLGRAVLDFRCESTHESPVIDVFGTARINWVETTWVGQTSSRTYKSEEIMADPVPYHDSTTVSELTPKNVIAASPTTRRSSSGDSSGRDSGKTSIDTTVASLTTTSIVTRGAPYGSSGLEYYRPPHIDMGSGNSGTPIGAIVGGVVGGVTSLVAVVLITFFYLRRRKRRTAGTTSQPLMQSMVSAEMSMAQNQTSSDSNPNDGSESLQTGGVCELQGQQRQEPSVHELPSQISHHHHGQIHELA
ncbi:hypothetical protein E4U31_000682 [Claviceps sp. LM219 group G6]|nr:hypothetical protein E4U15_000049 [Claviceps sp. LM218 group G6]KAG6106639.1 hypothetical protein E4U31_000682 [Claviceps sp. LM219 group G6]